MKGPDFLKYFKPLLETLKENGGAGKTSEIVDAVIDKMNIPEDELEVTLASGAYKVRNSIQFARLYLVKSDYMDSAERGLWKLTEKGFNSQLDDKQVYQIFKEVQEGLTKRTNKKDKTAQDQKEVTQDFENEEIEDESHSTSLLNLLKELSPGGFEKICKRLLIEIGLENVQITGNPNDQGIDGTGLIKINEIINFTVIFQCKRYKETVSPSYIRDFRGTMQGRADKAIFITTGRFTQESKNEAKRDGVPPIELIDGEKLVSLFEKYQLGLKPKQVYDINFEFFNNFK